MIMKKSKSLPEPEKSNAGQIEHAGLYDRDPWLMAAWAVGRSPETINPTHTEIQLTLERIGKQQKTLRYGIQRRPT